MGGQQSVLKYQICVWRRSYGISVLKGTTYCVHDTRFKRGATKLSWKTTMIESSWKDIKSARSLMLHLSQIIFKPNVQCGLMQLQPQSKGSSSILLVSIFRVDLDSHLLNHIIVVLEICAKWMTDSPLFSALAWAAGLSEFSPRRNTIHRPAKRKAKFDRTF